MESVRCLLYKQEDPELSPPESRSQKLGLAICASNSSAGEMETGSPTYWVSPLPVPQ